MTESLPIPPLPLRLKPSRLKWTLMLLGSIAFVLAGLWVAPLNPFAGYSCTAFFGLGVLIAGVNLHPASSYLVIDTDGFTFSNLFRKHFVPWSQVQSFTPVRIGLNKMVGWNFTSEYRKTQTLRAVNTALAGAEAALPDTYGKSPRELSELLESYRTKYGHTAL